MSALESRSVVRRGRRARAGFTLMEVLLVLAILVILGGIVTMTFTKVFSGANVDGVKGQIHALETPIDLYWKDMKAYPTSLQALVTAPADVDASKWQGPYLQKALPPDPWGGEYKIRVPGTYNPNSYDVWSAGPDRVDGTADDIGNWQQAAAAK